MTARCSGPLTLALLTALTWNLLGAAAHAGRVTSVVPAAASADATIRIMGSGFSPSADANVVTFTPSTGGPGVTGVVTAVSPADSTGTLRRLSVRMPAGLGTGPTAISVRNATTGEVSDGASVQAVTLQASPAHAIPGSTIEVTFSLAGNAAFDASASRVAFGAGITLNRITVASPTSLVASITVAATSALGPRPVGVLTPNMTAVAPFEVRADQPPENRAPTARVTSPASVASGAPITFDGSTSSDQDAGDVLTYEWRYENQVVGTDPTLTRTFTVTSEAVVTVSLTVRDGRGGENTATRTVTVTVGPPPANRAPTAAFVFSPASPLTTDAVMFDAGTSSEPDGDSLTYAWTFETLDPATGVVAARTFPVPGTFTVTLTVNDGRGGVDTETKTVTVTAPANRPPTATFTITPASPVAGESASFDASASSDPDGEAITFSWAFGNDAPVSGAQVSRVFAQPGTHVVRLTVTDRRGASTEFAQNVIVGAQPNRTPTAAFSSSTTSALVDAIVSFDGSASTDPDGDPLTSAWTFGDNVAGIGAQVGHVFSTPGTFTVSLTVTDGRGGAATASQTVTVTGTPPANRPPSAVITGATRGTADVAVSFDGRGSNDPDNDPLTHAWDFGVPGSGASSPTPSFTYPEAGTFTVSLTVSDGQGASSTATRSIVIDPAADKAPPVITLSGPAQALPGTMVTFTADASDNVGVSLVRFTVDDGASIDLATAPYERQIALPAVAAPGQQLVVKATAFDAAGNSASALAALTVRVVPDTTPPTVLLVAPPTSAPGSPVLLSARVSDDSGVAGVVFIAAGAEIGRAGAPPFTATFSVAPDAQPGTSVPLIARATDVAGNVAEYATALLIVALPDTTPPTLTLEAPAQALPGERVTMTATATDHVGVADVRFAVDSAELPLQVAAPWSVSYVVPPQTPPGSTLTVSATARDFSANQARASKSIAIVAPQAVTRSVIAGEVYDDATGLPLAGVAVQLSGTDAQGLQYGEQATTDARGRYTIRATSGVGRLRISKAGYTHAWREVTLPAGQAVEPLDARLTPVGGATGISGLSGGTLTRRAHALAVPAGVLSGALQVAMTVVSGQGLRALLPAGWSPIGVIDVGPDALSLSSAATWRAPNAFGLGAGRPVIVARYDETSHAWRATGGATRSAQGEFEAPVSRGGQHVLLVPDSEPAAPALPGAGAQITGVTAPALDAAALGALAPSPTVLFYKPGVFSTVTSSVAPTALTSSGLVLRASVGESYTYLSGDSVTTDPFAQDLVFFQMGADTNGLAAVHVVSPSLAFDAIALKQGVISVALVAVPPGVGVPLAGPDGGTVNGQNGTALVVPPGALSEQTPLTLDTFEASGLGGLLTPLGLSIAGALQLGFEGTLQLPAALSIPQPAGLTDPSRALLVQVLEVGGRTRLVLRALARLSGGRLVSDVTLGGAPTALEGVRTPGRYLFLRSDVPLGFASGLVRGTGGAPFAGALVSTTAFATVSLSRGDGAYFAAAPSGPTTFVAADVVRADRGTGAATLPFNAVTPLDLTLAPQPPTVTSIAPADGAVNVALASAITVTFSKPIDVASLTAATVSLGSGSSAIAATLALSSTGTVLTVRPEAPLASNTRHTFTLAANVADLSGNRLGQPVAVTFDTLDTAPPPLPPAGSITASIPANGLTTVAASQGTASPRDRVTIRNLATKQQQVALVNGDGSFSAQIAVALTHTLQIVIRDQAGNETVVDVPRYRNADGSTAIGPEGGDIAAGGLTLSVKPGTFPQGAIVRFTAVPRDQVAYDPGPDYPFVAAFEISASVRPQIYLDVSAPAPPGTDPRTTGIVGEVITVLGQPTLDIVDTAKIVDGRLKTSSPPCEGIVKKFGRYAMFLNQDERMRFGIALLEMVVPRQREVVVQPFELPVAATATVPAFMGTPLYPGLTFNQLHTPVAPMVARIYDRLLREDDEDEPPLNVLATIATPLNIQTIAACAASEACAPNIEAIRPVCAPIPPDRPIRVVVRDANTGEVLLSTPVGPTPAGQNAAVAGQFYYAPNDVTPPKVLWTSWDAQPPHVLDTGRSLQVRFSEPMTAAGGGEGPAWLVNQRTGQRLPVGLRGTLNNRLITFLPPAPLPQGTDFVLFTPGLRDIAGNAVTTTLQFRTYSLEFAVPRSTPVGQVAVTSDDARTALTAAGFTLPPDAQFSFGLSKIDFVTLRPEETLDGKWKTTLFGTGDQRERGAMYLTFDASDAAQPAALGYAPSINRAYSAFRVFEDVHVRFRGAYQAPMAPAPRPDPPQLAAWRVRELWTTSSDPRNRICAPPGDPRIQQWKDRVLAKFPGASLSMQPGCGTLGLAGSFTNYYGILHVVDFTDPERPYEFTRRLLSDYGAIVGYPRQWHAPEGSGVPRSFDLLFGLDIDHEDFGNTKFTNEDTVGAYVPVQGLGLERIDLGQVVPDILLPDRPRGQIAAGGGLAGAIVESVGLYTFPYYRAVRTTANRQRVIAAAGDKREGTNLALVEMFDASLEPVGVPLEIPAPANEMELVPGFELDLDGDGTDEPRELAFITTDAGLVVVDVVAAQSSMQIIGFVPMRSSTTGPQGTAVSYASGTCPSREFNAGGFSLYVTGTATQYYGGTCEDLNTGARVLVTGQPISPGRVFASRVRFFKTGDATLIRRMTRIQIDAERKMGYAVAEWDQAGARYFGIVTFDLDNPTGGLVDADGDGNDDRVVAFTRVVGPGAPGGQAGSVEDLRFDPARRLLYAALSPQPKDTSSQSLAILRTCRCPELDGSLRLTRVRVQQTGDPGATATFPSSDGKNALVFVTEAQRSSGSVDFDLESVLTNGLQLRYVLREVPPGNDTAKAVFDLPTGTQTGFASVGLGKITLALRPSDDLVFEPSQVVIDFWTESDVYVDQVVATVLPAVAVVGPSRLQTRIDRVNGDTCDSGDSLRFFVPYDARVTLTVDGVVLPRYENGLAAGSWQDVTVPAGITEVYVSRQLLPTQRPGEHPVQLVASFPEAGGITVTATGTLLHEIEIFESLPIGQPFVKGVAIRTGNLSVQREDAAFATTGPQLSFSRTYTSAGQSLRGTMGAGWTHNWEARLVRDTCGVITIIGGEGSGTRFSPTSTGFKPQVGSYGTLKYDIAQDAYDFYTKTRVRSRYERTPQGPYNESTYRLALIEDRHGNRLSLSYGAQAPFLLEEVRDAANSILTFEYERDSNSLAGSLGIDATALHRVVRVRGPMNLELSFTYDARGNLASATRADRAPGAPAPAGERRVEQYVYSVDDPRDRHNLVRIVGPNNAVTGGDVTEYVYFADTDAFPGENPAFQWGSSIIVVPEKYELVKQVVEGAGSPEVTRTEFAYDYSNTATGNVTKVTDPREVETVYAMNVRGGLVTQTVKASMGDLVTKSRWAYDDGVDQVWLTALTEPNNRVTKYEYDANGNLTKETIETADLGPVVSSWDFEPVYGQLVRSVDARGVEAVNEVNPDTGLTTSTTIDPGYGQPLITRTFTYDAKGRLVTDTDGRGHTTKFLAYNAMGQVTQVEDPLGNVTTHAYDDRGRRTSTVDTMGREALFEYDALDRQTRVTRRAGKQPAADMVTADQDTRTKHLPGGQVVEETSGPDHVRRYTYDAINRLASQEDRVFDANGVAVTHASTFARDGNGNVVSETDPTDVVRAMEYDDLNRVTSVRVNGQLTLAATYDAVGNKLSEADLHGHVTAFSYDGLYRQVATNHALAPYKTIKTFDLVGNVTSQTDPNGRTTQMTYDGANRLVEATDALKNVTRYRYDAAGNKVEVVNVTKNSSQTATFDAINRPLSVTEQFTDPLNGQAVTYTTTHQYDDVAHGLETTDPRGVVTRQRFNGLGQVMDYTLDPSGLGLTTQYRYDARGNRVAVRDPQGGDIDVETVYDGLNRAIRSVAAGRGADLTFYNGLGNVTRSIDRAGTESVFDYDDLGRRTRTTVRETRSNNGDDLVVARTVFDDAANTIARIDANGRTTTEYQDALHRPVRIVDPLGNELRSEYDSVNQTATIDKRSFRTEMSYDALDRPTETREFDATGTLRTRIRQIYDDAQTRVTEVSRGGVERVTQFDAMGRERRVSVRHPDLAAQYGAAEFVTSEQEYDAGSLPTAAVDANGHRTTYGYDAARRLVARVDGAGSPSAATTTFTYDAAGNLLTSKDGRTTGSAFDVRYTYDVAYRRTSAENATGEVTRYEYDVLDRLVKATEPKGAVYATSYTYDEFGKLTAVDETRGGAGGVSRYQYDANRNLIAQQDAIDSLTTFRYDPLNRVTDIFRHLVPGGLTATSARTSSPGGDEATANRWRFEYDANDNQAVLIDPAGQRVAKTYDYLDRLTAKLYSQHRPGTPLPRLTAMRYTHDAESSITRVEEDFEGAAGPLTRATDMTYDRLQRLSSVTNPDQRTVQYAYDRQGNRRQIVDADGIVTTHAYDERNRAVRVTTENGPQPGTTTYAYWPNGLLREVSYPNGTVMASEHDAASRLTGVTNHDGNPASPIAAFTYTYDANGNRTGQTERSRVLTGGAAVSTAYQYDSLDRLAGVSYPNGAAVDYQLAANGNRLTERGTDPVSGLPLDRLLAYNAMNELTLVTDATDPSQSVEFRYDENGNRIEQRLGTIVAGAVPNPTSTRRFTFDIRDQLVEVETPSGTVSYGYDFTGQRVQKRSSVFDIKFLYSGANLLQEYDAASRITTAKYNYGPSGLVSFVTVAPAARRSHFYLLDGIGSTAGLTDEQGAVVASYLYDAWGRLRQRADQTSNRRLFTGHYYDSETDLQYFGARYYDGVFGQFLSRDPAPGTLTSPVTFAPYQYAAGNPLMYGDPDGRVINLFAAAGLGALGAIGGCVVGVVTDVGCGKGALVGGAAGLVTGLTFGLATAAVGSTLALGLTDGALLAGTLAGATGGFTANFLGSAVAQHDQGQEIDWRMAAEYGSFGAFTGALGGAIGGVAAAGASGEIAAAGGAPLGRELLGNVAGDLTGQVVEIGLSTRDFSQVSIASALGGAAFSSTMGRMPGALKSLGLRFAPTSNATAAQRAALRQIAGEQGLQIGIRATDPLTALGTRLLHKLLPGIPAKPMSVKAKSVFGLAYDPQTRSYFRSDLDVAWVYSPAAGRGLSAGEIQGRVVEPFKRLMNESRGLPEDSIRHGAHFNAREFLEARLSRAAMTQQEFEAAVDAGVGAIGSPGPVAVFRASGIDVMSEDQVRSFARMREWAAMQRGTTRAQDRDLTDVPAAVLQRERREAGRWEWPSAWDVKKPTVMPHWLLLGFNPSSLDLARGHFAAGK